MSNKIEFQIMLLLIGIMFIYINYQDGPTYGVVLNGRTLTSVNEVSFVQPTTTDGNNNTSSTTTVPRTTTTTVPRTTTTTVPRTTTTTVPRTTTTTIKSQSNWSGTNFNSKEEWLKHIKSLQFYEGIEVNNGRQDEYDNCASSVRGCREFSEVFFWIGNLNFSLPRSGGNRAFGSVTISLPKGYTFDFGVDLIACPSLNLSCPRNSWGDYEVNLSILDYSFRDFGGYKTYYLNLVGTSVGNTRDTSFFYPEYFYFVNELTLFIYDETQTKNRWTGIVSYYPQPGYGTYATQYGWNAKRNIGWVNPNYTFLWAGIDEYQNTPYYSP